jgi:formamidase
MAATHEIQVDRAVPLYRQAHTGHNRWHPGVPAILTIASGDTVVMETRDALDGMVTPDTVDEDVARLDLGRVHPLTGPIYVTGAEPGDLLEVKVLEVISQPFGYTLQIPGAGFLREFFPSPLIIKWQIVGDSAVSPQLPGVRIPGAPFMGVMGLAPSLALLQRASAREADLLRRGGFVLPPCAAGAVPSEEPLASEGLRTLPPRENGGNLDIKQLTAGTKLLLPVFEKGALFSAGDGHFVQGDGESCGTAIEMAATLKVQLNLHQGRAAEEEIRWPQFEGVETAKSSTPRPYFATTGVPVFDGRNESEDVSLAAKAALLSMIDHLVSKYGFGRAQAYALTSVAVDLRISQVVDVPNVLVSAFLPLDIFVGN